LSCWCCWRAVWPGCPDAGPDLLRAHLTHRNAKLIGAGHPGLRNVRSAGYALRVVSALLIAALMALSHLGHTQVFSQTAVWPHPGGQGWH